MIAACWCFAALGLQVAPHLAPPRRAVGGRQLRVQLSLPVGRASDGQAIDEQRSSLQTALVRDELKLQLLRACAACNRGFGASEMDRAFVDSLLESLSRTNPCEDATAGVEGSESAERWVGRGLENADYLDPTVANGPLEGTWRLIYTNASDVLSLDSSPIAGVGPISQEITLPASVVNVIELYPRALSLLPVGALRTSTRLRVGTRARARSPTRIGLTFETIGIEARDLLGVDVTKLLPMLSIPLPRPLGDNSAGADSDDSPAYFEVRYLDSDLLVIQQNQPGGAFVLSRETQEELRWRSDPRLA